MSAPFEAKFGGVCDACDERIAPGQMVRYSEDYDNGSPIHDDCDSIEAITDVDRDAAREVCTDCWLLKPCGCET